MCCIIAKSEGTLEYNNTYMRRDGIVGSSESVSYSIKKCSCGESYAPFLEGKNLPWGGSILFSLERSRPTLRDSFMAIKAMILKKEIQTTHAFYGWLSICLSPMADMP